MEIITLVKAGLRNRKGIFIGFIILTALIVVGVVTMIGVSQNYDNAMKKAFDEHNNIKRILTRNGNQIDIIDNHEGDGEKDKITITTSTGAHKFELDNEKKKILISDKEGENKIELV